MVGTCLAAMVFKVSAQQANYTYNQSGDLASVASTGSVAPAIQAQPQTQLLQSNNAISFSVVATGAGVSYQWYSNGVVIIGATTDSLVQTNISGSNLTNFTVVISNASGSVTSTAAAIWPDSNGNGIPDWWELKYFGNLNQPADGDFDGDGVSNIDEYREGTIPNNAASYSPRLHIQAANGRVVGSPDLPYYTMGQIVTLTAVPDSGQEFLGWSGSISGKKPDISLIMNSHKTVIASFGIPLPVALDNTNVTWTTGGSAPWFGQTQVSEDGMSAGQSGLIGDNQESWVQGVVNVSQPAQVGFWWSVSSQPPDALSFSVDGHVLGSISGEALGWQFMRADLTPGNHTLLWTYSKNSADLPTGIPFFDGGWVDEVGLTPYGTGCVSPPSGLVAWWAGQKNALDGAGTNNGTLVGGVNYVAGEVGEAFNFGGVNGYVSVSSSPALNLTNALTIEGWIRLNNLNTYYFIATKQPSGTAGNGYSGNLEFRIAPNGYMQLLHQTSTALTFATYVATLGISTGMWHHVAVTLASGGNVNFYLDGVPAGTSPQQGTFGITNSQPLRMGTRADGYSYFNGLIDELSIYNRALSADEIDSIYLAGAKGKCPLPVRRPGPLPVPLQLMRSGRAADGLRWTANGFLLTLDGLNGQGSVVLYSSTNLVSWAPIYTNPPATGSIQLLDSSSTNSSSRFYRAILYP